MSEPEPPASISIRDNGPLVVTAGVTLVDAQGGAFTTDGKLFLCRCGRSGKKPFCDGTHKREGFESAPRAGGPA